MKMIIVLLLSAVPCFAAADLNVAASSPSRVFFDDAVVGQTPTAIREAAPGFHQLKVQCIATSEVRIYDLYSPASVAIRKDIDVRFAGAPEEEVASEAPGVSSEVAGEKAAYDKQAQKEREKRHLTNGLLAGAVANELLNKGRSKGAVRGITLGGALLNQLIKR